ncbi:acyltransferase family protein [Streptomyces paludis]|uniref:Acyltransferase n=1 Tax=Streptomyces paludis TaxID=2282738 RepID=A0A345HS25_9ACTN|nr:acyltransferase [Streptomyces paludis]AXG79499.1 acyltransferase [Streptomyces paludis]
MSTQGTESGTEASQQFPGDSRHAHPSAVTSTGTVTDTGARARARSRVGRRLYAIDGIRLLAALMVAVHHYAGTRRVDQPGNLIWGRPASDIMPTVFRFAAYGWIGVEIFFVISGFVICMSCWGRSPKQFFVSRVIRLYPAYWFAIVFTTSVLVAFPGVWDHLPTRDVLFNFTMLQSGSGVMNVDGVYWTLWAELRFYLLFLAVVRTGLTYRKVVVFCCVWGAAAMIAPIAKLPLLELVANPEGAWYFIAGLVLYLMHRFGQNLLLWGILAMAWLMGQRELGIRIDEVEHVSSWRGAVLIFTVFLLTMVAIALGATDRIRWKWLVTAGAMTYPLYLMHYAAGTTVIHYLRNTMDPRLLVATVIAGFMVLGWLVYRIVERPLSGALKRGLATSFAQLRKA